MSCEGTHRSVGVHRAVAPQLVRCGFPETACPQLPGLGVSVCLLLLGLSCPTSSVSTAGLGHRGRDVAETLAWRLGVSQAGVWRGGRLALPPTCNPGPSRSCCPRLTLAKRFPATKRLPRESLGETAHGLRHRRCVPHTRGTPGPPGPALPSTADRGGVSPRAGLLDAVLAAA